MMRSLGIVSSIRQRMRRPRRLFAALTNALFLLLTWQGTPACAGPETVGSERVSAAVDAPPSPHHASHAASGRACEGLEAASTHGDHMPCHAPGTTPTCASMPACAAIAALPATDPCADSHGADRGVASAGALAPLARDLAPDPPPPRR